MLVEQVAGSPWNGWPDAHGIRGRITVVRATRAIKAVRLSATSGVYAIDPAELARLGADRIHVLMDPIDN